MSDGYIGVFRVPQEASTVDTVAPESPTNVILGSAGRNTISTKLAISGYLTLVWEHNSPPDLDRFEVAICEGGQTPEQVDIIICSKDSGDSAKFDKPAFDTVKFDGVTSSIKIDGLKPNTTYFAAVRAVDSSSNKSSWSFSSPISTGSEEIAIASNLSINELYRGLSLDWDINEYTDYVNILFDGSGATPNKYITKYQGDEIFVKFEENATYSGITLIPFNVEGTAGTRVIDTTGWTIRDLYTDDANYSGIAVIAQTNDADLDIITVGTRGTVNGVQADVIRNNANSSSLFDSSDQMQNVSKILVAGQTFLDITNKRFEDGASNVLYDISNGTINDMTGQTLISMSNKQIEDGSGNILLDLGNSRLEDGATNVIFDLSNARMRADVYNNTGTTKLLDVTNEKLQTDVYNISGTELLLDATNKTVEDGSGKVLLNLESSTIGDGSNAPIIDDNGIRGGYFSTEPTAFILDTDIQDIYNQAYIQLDHVDGFEITDGVTYAYLTLVNDADHRTYRIESESLDTVNSRINIHNNYGAIDYIDDNNQSWTAYSGINTDTINARSICGVNPNGPGKAQISGDFSVGEEIIVIDGNGRLTTKLSPSDLLIRTQAIGQRIQIDSIDNTLRFYDSSNVEIIKIDDNIFSTTPGIIVYDGMIRVQGGSGTPTNYCDISHEGWIGATSENFNTLGGSCYISSNSPSYAVSGTSSDTTSNTYGVDRHGVYGRGNIQNITNTSIPIGVFGTADTLNTAIDAIGGRFDSDEIALQLRYRTTPANLVNFKVDSSGYLNIIPTGDRLRLWESAEGAGDYCDFYVDTNGYLTIDPAGARVDVDANIYISNDENLIFDGTAGGVGNAIKYIDSGSGYRVALGFYATNIVALSNRAANGVVQIRANNSTAGSAGEQTVVQVEDNEVNIYQDIINDDIVYPEDTISGTNTSRVIKIDCSKFDDVTSGKMAAAIRGGYEVWFSTTQFGTPSFLNSGSSYTLTLNNGTAIKPTTPSLTAFNDCIVSDSSGILQFTISTGLYSADATTFYIHLRLQGITYSYSTTMYITP